MPQNFHAIHGVNGLVVAVGVTDCCAAHRHLQGEFESAWRAEQAPPVPVSGTLGSGSGARFQGTLHFRIEGGGDFATAFVSTMARSLGVPDLPQPAVDRDAFHLGCAQEAMRTVVSERGRLRPPMREAVEAEARARARSATPESDSNAAAQQSPQSPSGDDPHPCAPVTQEARQAAARRAADQARSVRAGRARAAALQIRAILWSLPELPPALPPHGLPR